mgnify:CR=1 FL=1|tara:strand:+ start:367 stop:663 length:297 start_codon:yes stop_codon:yes gene_type:complete
MKITRKRIREIVKETLDKKLVEQEPRQTSAGAQVDREMRKGNVDRAMSQVDTQREFEEHLNKMMQQAMLGMKKNKNLARQVFRSWAQDLINNKEFWGS